MPSLVTQDTAQLALQNPPLAPAQASTGKVRLTALIVAGAMFMEQTDGTVLATALPAMAASFHTGVLHMNVALTSYLLSLAVFIPVSGTMADRFGASTIFRAAIAIFTIGSILCAQADSLLFLVASRIVQGIGGAMMVPVGRLVLLRTASKGELVMAMTWMMVPAALGPVCGPPLGGFFVTYMSWHWIFYINVPIGVLGIVLATLFIGDVREPTGSRFDLTGFLLTAIALATLMYGLEMASRGMAGGALTIAMLTVGIAAAALYVWHARHSDHPLLDLTLFRIPTFAISVVAGALSRIAVGAMPFLLPMMLQLGFGISAAQSGLITFSSAAGSLLMRAASRPMLHRIGFRNTLIWVGLISTLLLATCAAFRPAWPVAAIYAALLLGGFFQSLQFIAYNTIAYADIPRERMSAATSLYTTFQQLCLTLGITTAAATLGAAIRLSGHTSPKLGDFSSAFIVVALVALFAPLVSLRLDRDAGSELAGRKRQDLARR
jgi:EmrB/QacA subfamily drug resistance transporter